MVDSLKNAESFKPENPAVVCNSHLAARLRPHFDVVICPLVQFRGGFSKIQHGSDPLTASINEVAARVDIHRKSCE